MASSTFILISDSSFRRALGGHCQDDPAPARAFVSGPYRRGHFKPPLKETRRRGCLPGALSYDAVIRSSSLALPQSVFSPFSKRSFHSLRHRWEQNIQSFDSSLSGSCIHLRHDRQTRMGSLDSFIGFIDVRFASACVLLSTLEQTSPMLGPKW